jgi:hypothetical protein
MALRLVELDDISRSPEAHHECVGMPTKPQRFGVVEDVARRI